MRFENCLWQNNRQIIVFSNQAFLDVDKKKILLPDKMYCFLGKSSELSFKQRQRLLSRYIFHPPPKNCEKEQNILVYTLRQAPIYAILNSQYCMSWRIIFNGIFSKTKPERIEALKSKQTGTHTGFWMSTKAIKPNKLPKTTNKSGLVFFADLKIWMCAHAKCEKRASV